MLPPHLPRLLFRSSSPSHRHRPCRLLSMNKYRNAGTVEFLVDKEGNH